MMALLGLLFYGMAVVVAFCGTTACFDAHEGHPYLRNVVISVIAVLVSVAIFMTYGLAQS